MSEFRKIKISDYTYELPDNRIARYPLLERDNSNLLIWKQGNIQKSLFKNISHYLPTEVRLVFNNTRVIHARLFFFKETGAKIEIFCLEPKIPSDYQQAFQQTNKTSWKCMIGNAKKWKEEELLSRFNINGKPIELRAKKAASKLDSFLIEFSWTPGFTFAEIIDKAGKLPIPPYLNRDTEPIDEITYQTIYAKNDGSVAAPTAGLHFTENVLSQLKEKKIKLSEITLHVGAGTFQPVKAEHIGGHAMHHETVIIPKHFIEDAITNPGKIIAVGTTSVRSLESLYWLGLKLQKHDFSSENIVIGQWEPYEAEESIDVQASLRNILAFLNKHGLDLLRFSTQIIILPGYRFKLVEGMITNFHQPQSTLLLLISAFLGDDWKKLYHFAMKNNFRFLSYGDSNLYLK